MRKDDEKKRKKGQRVFEEVFKEGWEGQKAESAGLARLVGLVRCGNWRIFSSCLPLFSQLLGLVVLRCVRRNESRWESQVCYLLQVIRSPLLLATNLQVVASGGRALRCVGRFPGLRGVKSGQPWCRVPKLWAGGSTGTWVCSNGRWKCEVGFPLQQLQLESSVLQAGKLGSPSLSRCVC